VLRAVWGRQLSLSHSAACSLLIAAGDAAGDAAGGGRGDPEAALLFEELRTALFGGGGGGGGGAASQRRRARRGEAAAHEYIRALAIGEWRAGAVTAAEAEARSFALLAEAGVLPRPALLASLASLHAGEGGVRAGAEALSRLSARRGAPRPREGAFLALLQAACSVEEPRSGTRTPLLPAVSILFVARVFTRWTRRRRRFARWLARGLLPPSAPARR